MARRRGILILCGDADANLGDRAILGATCAALRSVEPCVPITVVSREPKQMRKALDVDVVRAGPRGVVALCRAAARSRVVLVGGGGLFQDDDSLVKMPYWAARCLLVRGFCDRVIGYSLGVGPLDSFTGRMSGRVAFATMSRISVRDGAARDTAQALSSRSIEVVPDPAFMYSSHAEADGAGLLAGAGVPMDDGPLLGVALRRWFPPRPRLVPHKVASRFRDRAARDDTNRLLVEAWADTLDRVLERTGGRAVMLPTYTAAHEGDDRLCSLVQERMCSDRAHLVRLDDPAQYLAVAKHLALMIGGRMHPTILAAAAGTPIVGLSYNPKFSGVFELLGVPDQLMPVEDLVERGDIDRFEELILRVLRSSNRPPGDAPSTIGASAAALAERTRGWIAEVLASC